MFNFETIKYFMISTSFTNFVMGAVLILLFIQSRQRHMMFWGGAFIAYSIMFLIDFFNVGLNKESIFYILYRLPFSLYGSSLILTGAYHFFGKKLPRKFLALFMVFTVLLILCFCSGTIYSILLIPMIICCAFTLICAGILFNINNSQGESAEEYLLSFAIILWSVYSNNSPFTRAYPLIATINYFISLLLLNSILILLIIVHLKRNRLALAKQEAHYRMLVENASGLIFLFDYEKQKFDYISPYAPAALGLSVEGLLKDPSLIFQYLDETDSEKMCGLLFDPAGSMTNFIFKSYHSGTPPKWYELYATPIVNDPQTSAGVEFVIRDITSRVDAEKNLERSEEARENLIEDISHELRTPVTIIQGYSESLINGTVGASEYKIFLEIINSKIITLNTLLEDLIQVSRFTSHSIEYKFYEHNASSLFTKILNQYVILIRNEGFRCSSSVEIEEDYYIIADEYRIGQVFSNIVNNAMKYSEKSACLEITCLRLEDKIQIQIKDAGSGIPEHELPFIFTRKYKGEISSSGFGLGLYISKEIIKQHGGEIWANNNSDKGASLYFTIPCYTNSSA